MDIITLNSNSIFHLTILFITFIKSVNYITCNIIEFLINKVLDVKPLVPYLSKIMPIV